MALAITNNIKLLVKKKRLIKLELYLMIIDILTLATYLNDKIAKLN
ncbi:hypothetical protein SJAV_26360 [Sulfurisphaera javensis]|uniref:Uncharacterized protein n=1 Tax=Sulfurisphaera javensis TaxID=2049879 RepID=A0AAT9GUR0_9CREN